MYSMHEGSKCLDKKHKNYPVEKKKYIFGFYIILHFKKEESYVYVHTTNKFN